MPSSSSSSSSSSSHGCIESLFKSFTASVSTARKLRNVETIGKLDPYVIVKCGKESVSSNVFKDAGCDPTFNLNYRVTYKGEKNITFIVMDKKKLGKDKECGRFKMTVGLAAKRKLTHHAMNLKFTDKKGEKDSGVLNVSLRFHKEAIEKSCVMSFKPEPEGPKKVDIPHKFKSLRFTVVRARNLKDVEVVGKIDPYAVVALGKQTVKSDVFKNAGVNPKIFTSFLLPYDSERELSLKFFDDETLGKDKPVGSVKIDLLPFFLGTGGRRLTLALKGPDSATGGAVDCRLHFLEESCSKPSVTKLEIKEGKKHASSSSSSSSSS